MNLLGMSDDVSKALVKKLASEGTEVATKGAGGALNKVAQSVAPKVTGQLSLLDYKPVAKTATSALKDVTTKGAKVNPETIPTALREIMDKKLLNSPAEMLMGKSKPTIDEMRQWIRKNGSISSNNWIAKMDAYPNYYSGRRLNNEYNKLLSNERKEKLFNMENAGELSEDAAKFLQTYNSFGSPNSKIMGDNVANDIEKKLSEKLGIGRSHSAYSDRLLQKSRAWGDTWDGLIGLSGESVKKYKNNIKRYDLSETAKKEADHSLSTAGHERLHAFQDAANKRLAHNKMKAIGEENHLSGRLYDKQVTDAYEELQNALWATESDLNDKGDLIGRRQLMDKAPILNSPAMYREKYGRASYGEYLQKKIEQEARAFQQYMNDRFGITYENHTRLKDFDGKEFDPEKINPVFDKFINKLRELSAKGIALPATIAGIPTAMVLSAGKKESKE